jgi:hypothetical protein
MEKPIETVERKPFTADMKRLYIDLLRKGQRRFAAAKSLGISPRTISKHIRRYPQFASAVLLAEVVACDKVENALYKQALKGNVKAIEIWLYNRSPDRWADKRSVEHTGPGGGPIQLESTRAAVIAVLQGDESRELLTRLSERVAEAMPTGAPALPIETTAAPVPDPSEDMAARLAEETP